MIEQPPFVKLLGWADDALALVDFAAETGIADVTHRPFRNRNTMEDERWCVAVRFETDLPQQDGEVQNHNAWEKCRELTLSLIVDGDLETEDSGNDPTGLAQLGMIAAAAFKGLRDPAGPLAQKCDWMRLGGIEPDEDSTPDEGRLVYAVIVLYRVRSDDENVLLAQGEMG